MLKFIHRYFIPIIVLLVISCGSNEKQTNITTKDFNADKYKKPLEKANKELVKTEENEINDLIVRYGWKMQQTGTGLRYLVYKKGKGVKAEKGKVAKINFEVKLITGDVCYSSSKDGAKELLVGKSGEISGLEEGILLLKTGDRAKFIIPSHLAYGLLGDENKIPKRATLIYDVELLEIK